MIRLSVNPRHIRWRLIGACLLALCTVACASTNEREIRAAEYEALESAALETTTEQAQINEREAQAVKRLKALLEKARAKKEEKTRLAQAARKKPAKPVAPKPPKPAKPKPAVNPAPQEAPPAPPATPIVEIEVAAKEPETAPEEVFLPDVSIITLRPADWQTGSETHPLTGDKLCLLTSAPQISSNSRITASVHLVISPSELFIRSGAALDTAAVEASLSVDSGDPHGFDLYANEITAVIEENYTSVLNELLTGEYVSIVVAFQNSKGESSFQLIDFDLIGFEDAYAELDNC
ncbi:MAG: hypothetical protein KTR32_10840 [Granulosicoccus sp.]|nr:hypothetical protein [Granulosicoccus sp.]